MSAKTNPNFFYTDKYGREQGPITAQQFKTLAETGIITPNTPIETDIGHKGKAGQIPNLFKDTSSTQPLSDPNCMDLLELTEIEQSAVQTVVQNKSSDKNVNKTIGSAHRSVRRMLSQVFDTCIGKIIYFFVCIAIILLGLWLTLKLAEMLFSDTWVWKQSIAPWISSAVALLPHKKDGVVEQQEQQAALQKQREEEQIILQEQLLQKDLQKQDKEQEKERQQRQTARRKEEEEKEMKRRQEREEWQKQWTQEEAKRRQLGQQTEPQRPWEQPQEWGSSYINERKNSLMSEDIFGAAGWGTVNDVQRFLDKGTSVSVKDKNGWTPLHWAAGFGSIEVVKFLVSQGANVQAKTKLGKTPLSLAREKKNTAVVNYLTGIK